VSLSVVPRGRYVHSRPCITSTLNNDFTQARKSVNYVESDEDDDDDVLGPIANNSRGRATKRRRVSVDDDSDDEFGLDAATQQAMLDDGTSP
jgi:DNA mismatch repair protein MSH6